IYNLRENSKFKIDKSRKLINSYTREEFEKKFCRIHYRPFDIRYLFYDDSVIERMRKEVMLNVQESNIGLISVRQVAENNFNHSFITDSIIESRMTLSNKGIAYLYPLYILTNGVEKIFYGIKEPEIEYISGNKTKQGLVKTDNFKDDFRKFFKSKYKGTYSPEQILGYIYAVLHSPTYRTKYLEFLKIDFPRIPFTDVENLFIKLSEIGFDLIEHHLLKRTYSDNICRMSGIGDNYKVENVEYKQEKAWINKERCFEPIHKEIWNFQIGGYQVLDKWLKERKKHEITLSGEDIQHFIKVVNVLDYTNKTMGIIDDLTNDWI
ncbi:MAG: hypothetical protein QG635_865, partial [Bacteroidota bacterium]|nr:hypothetical protein [Bacteroidota bacterium]